MLVRVRHRLEISRRHDPAGEMGFFPRIVFDTRAAGAIIRGRRGGACDEKFFDRATPPPGGRGRATRIIHTARRFLFSSISLPPSFRCLSFFSRWQRVARRVRIPPRSPPSPTKRGDCFTKLNSDLFMHCLRTTRSRTCRLFAAGELPGRQTRANKVTRMSLKLNSLDDSLCSLSLYSVDSIQRRN